MGLGFISFDKAFSFSSLLLAFARFCSLRRGAREGSYRKVGKNNFQVGVYGLFI
jgi:hypothetical protein